MGFLDSVKSLVSKNTSTVDGAIDKLGQVVDQQTGNKYKGIVDQVDGIAKKEVDSTAPQAAAPQPPAPPAS